VHPALDVDYAMHWDSQAATLVKLSRSVSLRHVRSEGPQSSQDCHISPTESRGILLSPTKKPAIPRQAPQEEPMPKPPVTPSLVKRTRSSAPRRKASAVKRPKSRPIYDPTAAREDDDIDGSSGIFSALKSRNGNHADSADLDDAELEDLEAELLDDLDEL
jgi:hypothetical protein